jgi:hypothetical protein
MALPLQAFLATPADRDGTARREETLGERAADSGASP